MLERWMRSSAFFEAQLREHEITSSRESEEVSPGVILDFDADNQVVLFCNLFSQRANVNCPLSFLPPRKRIDRLPPFSSLCRPS
jgi:Protein of unknown function (DUF2283)